MLRRLKGMLNRMLYTIKHANGRVEKTHAENEQQAVEIYKVLGEEVEIIGKEELPSSQVVKRGMPQVPPGMMGPDPIANACALVGASAPQPQQAPATSGNVQQPIIPQPPQSVEFETDGVKFKVVGSEVFRKAWVEITDITEYKIEDDKIMHLEWIKIK